LVYGASTIDDPRPAPVLTFESIKAGIAKLRDCPTSDDGKSVVLPGRVALRVLSIVEAAETRGVIPGRCKDCAHWSGNHLPSALNWCFGVHTEEIEVPEDGSGFCWLFEAKP
jgi:hypothetical protein